METGESILERLMVGNRRFVEFRQRNPRRSMGRRKELVSGQLPRAIVLGCSDSRVSPTVIFDQGLGDLFQIRVAGNLVDDMVLASIEYAAIYCETPLLMVLGHSDCGAINAAAAGGSPQGHLHCLVDAIMPSLAQVEGLPGDRIDNAVEANALRMARKLAESRQVLAEFVQEGRLMVVAAKYDLETGIVKIL